MKRRQAIVVHKYSSFKYGLLDKGTGRIDAAVFERNLSIASMIEFQSFKQFRGLDLIEQIDLVQMPLHLARTDLLFLHHVVELCNQFIPAGSAVDGIFDLLSLLYTRCNKWERQQKKMFVLQLLAMIGYYPEHQKNTVDQWAKYAFESGLTISLAQEREVDQWLARCIAGHPRIALFKTLAFLKNSEFHEI